MEQSAILPLKHNLLDEIEALYYMYVRGSTQTPPYFTRSEGWSLKFFPSYIGRPAKLSYLQNRSSCGALSPIKVRATQSRRAALRVHSAAYWQARKNTTMDRQDARAGGTTRDRCRANVGDVGPASTPRCAAPVAGWQTRWYMCAVLACAKIDVMVLDVAIWSVFISYLLNASPYCRDLFTISDALICSISHRVSWIKSRFFGLVNIIGLSSCIVCRQVIHILAVDQVTVYLSLYQKIRHS